MNYDDLVPTVRRSDIRPEYIWSASEVVSKIIPGKRVQNKQSGRHARVVEFVDDRKIWVRVVMQRRQNSPRKHLRAVKTTWRIENIRPLNP